MKTEYRFSERKKGSWKKKFSYLSNNKFMNCNFESRYLRDDQWYSLNYEIKVNVSDLSSRSNGWR